MRSTDPAIALRIARETFEFAMSRGLTMTEARRKLAEQRWAESDRRLHARRQAQMPVLAQQAPQPAFRSFIDASQPPEREIEEGAQ